MSLLQSLGYRQVLARGFVLVRNSEGKPLRQAAAIAAGERLDLEFADGHVEAVAGKPDTSVAGEGARAGSTKRAPAKPRSKDGQSSLF